MRWIADECLPGSIVRNLRGEGHDVLFVAESHSGLRDEGVLEVANRESRLLITHDADFGQLLFGRANLQAPGIVFLRIPDSRRAARWPRLKTAVDLMGESLFGRFVTITEGRIRWRPVTPVR